jgi:hypothetical protein
MSGFTQSKALLLFTRNIIDFHSFLFVSLHFILTGKSEISTVKAYSHTIKLSWNKSNGDENCTVSYAIAWKDIRDGSRNGSNVTTNNSYVIVSLEACVTFEVSVSALYVNCSESEAAITNVTTLPDGKWHVTCRFMACAYTISYSACIQYSHQLNLLLQIS